MKVRMLAAVVAAAAIPVLAQTSSPPVEHRQATLEVQDTAKAAPKAAKKKPAKAKSRHHKTRKAKKKSPSKAATVR